MISYITRDKSLIPDDARIVFHVGKFYYFLVDGCTIVSGVQRIPWMIMKKKMVNNNATWYTPGNATSARTIMDAMTRDFLSSIKTPRDMSDNDNPMGMSQDMGMSSHTTLVDIQRERDMRHKKWNT